MASDIGESLRKSHEALGQAVAELVDLQRQNEALQSQVEELRADQERVQLARIKASDPEGEGLAALIASAQRARNQLLFAEDAQAREVATEIEDALKRLGVEK